MMRPTLTRKAIHDSRLTLYGGGLLSFALALLYVLLFPSISDSFSKAELPEYMEKFAGAAGAYTRPAGYMATEFFSAVPVILIIFAIVAGTAATAGEESAGTMEILLAQPITRRSIVIQKAAGIGVALAVALMAGLPGMLLGQLFVDFDLSPLRMLAALAFVLPLLWLFAAMAMFAGTILPSRGMAVALTTGAVVAAYVLHTVGLLVDSWGTARKFTPFYWADASRPLIGDYQPGWLALLVGLTAAFVIAAVFAFERRDISSGISGARWPGLMRRFKRHKGDPAASGMEPAL